MNETRATNKSNKQAVKTLRGHTIPASILCPHLQASGAVAAVASGGPVGETQMTTRTGVAGMAKHSCKDNTTGVVISNCCYRCVLQFVRD